MTVQKLIDYCEENGLDPEYTEVNVWANSALGFTPANEIHHECYGICLDWNYDD